MQLIQLFKEGRPDQELKLLSAKSFDTDKHNCITDEKTNEKKTLPTTSVFAKAGLDNVTSAICYNQQWFGLDLQF